MAKAKEINWRSKAALDYWKILEYLDTNWPEEVSIKFVKTLSAKLLLIKHHPNIGHKSSKHSRFRRTLVTKNYYLIYTVTKTHIIVEKLKHTKMK